MRLSNEIKMRTGMRLAASSLYLISLLNLCCLPSSSAATFDEQHKAASASLATQPESAVISLLKAGLDEGKAVLAVADAQKWLRNNQPADAILLYYAGRAAELSGDWKGAVALYQQYLAKADLKSATADEAVYATYILLIERLRDDNGAYAFGRNDGGRLMVCPQARQFDQWFLDQAIARNDATAVAQRLNACIAAGLPADLLNARYSQYFRWLLGMVDGYCDLGLPVTQDLYDSVKDLCGAMTHDEEMKLRLDWAVSVKAYNVAKIGDKAKKQVVRRPPGKVKGLNTPTAAKLPKKDAAKKAADAKAAAAQVVEEKKLELGDDVTPPIAESAALLEKYPRYVLWVMTGWAGGGNGPYYRGDFKKYWPHEAEAKMAPILAALSKLTPDEAAEFLNAAAYGGYVGSPGVLELRSVRQYVRATPELWKLRNGVVILPQAWNQLSADEAKTSAEKLAQIADPQISLVRAIAAGGNNYEKVMAALLGPEVWRLGPNELNGNWADMLWHHCGKPVSPLGRDQGIGKSAAVAASFAAGDAKKEDPADKRLAAFRNLWADYKSAQPKIPYAKPRAAAILKFTPELVPELLKDPNPEVQRMVRDAIAGGLEDAKGLLERDHRARGIPHGAYSPWIQRLANVSNGMDWMKQNKKDLYAPHPLEPVLRAAVAERLAQGKIEPWLTMAWINMQFPENNAEQVKVMQALFKSPAWAGVPTDLQVAAREWFKKDAMTPGQVAWFDAADPALVCKDLLSLTNTADVATTAAALQSAIAGVKKSPVKISIRGLDRLAAVTNTVFTDPSVMNQILEVTDGLRFFCDRASEPFGGKLLAYVSANKDPVLLHRTGAFLWSFGISEHYGSSLSVTMKLADSLLDDQPAAASALARIGLSAFSGNVPEHPRNWANSGRQALKALDGKAAMKLGLINIPVAPTDPSYPIYKSQADWLSGNAGSAWSLCDKSWAQLLPIHREMSVEYMLWVLQSTLNTRDEVRQEELIKAMMTWAAEPNSVLTPSQKAEIEIAYGDIAIQRGQLKQAGEIFLRTMQNNAYSNTTSRSTAALRRVTVQRIEKDFDAALQTLAELEMERVPEMWAPLRYARAEVFFDKTEYDNASEDIESILSRNPDHSEAKIMQGKLMLKRQRLMEATEVELGSADAKQTMVPGEALKVTLTDPTLAVSGIGSEIEVAVWAESGDKEHVLLRQFGDQKTKFRGEIATGLGAPKPDDRTLQVIGDEKIYYAYSERFRKKMNNLEEKRGGPITVASDALLMASARKLLSEAEQRVSDMQAKMDELKLKGTSASSARAIVQAGRAAELTTDSKGESVSDEPDRLSLEARQKRLAEERLKPGNPVYIRVIDPDRSRTAGIDEVRVSVESSSGDAIGQIVLKETGTHTGWFEGSVPTAGGTPKAFADDSEPGRNPNMVISPLTTYPAWRPVAQAGKVPEFKIDLNDNVALGEMTITAKETGAKLKKFVVYAGMNADEMMLVTSYPQDLISVAKPWHPSVTIMNDTDYHHNQNLRSVYDIGELQQQLDRGWLSQQFAAGVAENVAGPSVAMTNSIPAKVKWLRNNHHHNAHVVYRFRGYFYEPDEVTRRFKVVLGPYAVPANTHPSVANPPQFLLAVDGKPITSKDKPDLLEGEIALRAGVHRFEIWATGWDCTIGFGRTVKLQSNLADPANLADCPDSFFDPEAFPKGILAPRCPRAEVSASSEGTSFKVKFAPDSKARIINLVFMGQEGPVPVLNRISLSDTVGKQILPVAFDFAELGKNNVLEIITGDKVAVRYEDDRFVTKEKSKHERLLNVAFTTASMQFEFFEMRKNDMGDDVEYYEKLLRYELGKPVVLTITDADMDVSSKPDTVQVTLVSKTGKKRQFAATETGDSTGNFRLRVTPVGAAPADDKQVQVGEGETLTAVYRDAENTDPGVPADRYASLRHATFVEPAMFISHATVSPIPATNRPPAVALNEGFSTAEQDFKNTRKMTIAELRAYGAGKGMVQPRWQVSNRLCPTATPPTNGFDAVLGRRLYIDLEAAHLALRVGSGVEVYVQTEAGRKLAAQDRPAADAAAGTAVKPPVFDVTVPGTLAIAAGICSPAAPFRFETPQIPIYQEGLERDGKLTDGRFACSVALIPNVIPDHGILSAEEYEQRRAARTLTHQNGLAVKPGDTVHVGFRYRDRDGTEKWLTGSAKIITHPVLDVMEKDYRSAKTSAYVGESLALRVVDLGADLTDRSDTLKVQLKARSGASHSVELIEVDTHSGVFKGLCPLSYVKTGSNVQTNSEYNVKAEGFPVVYGDVIGVRYTDAKRQATDTLLISICKGADGLIEPFSKRFDDPEMAVRTHFAIAESSLEVAKAYRASGDHAKADREYAVAKQMLAGTLDKFKDQETRSQAEFILGNLTLEEADTTKKTDMKEDLYRAALSRYMNVIGSYPDTLHASKAQFKIATVYEKLKEPDIAAQEYVKLAYKYPDSEFLAIAMARLGTHFQRKADEYEKKAKPLLEKKDNKDAQFEGAAVQKMAVAEYLKAANIFDRMQAKFPDHEMAGKCGLRAGQSYMRAGDNRRAVSVFNRVVKNDSYDGPEVRAQALYWAGISYESLGESMAAYSSYKRLTYDFPESTWAAYARAQLSQDRLMNLETDLEIKRLQEGR